MYRYDFRAGAWSQCASVPHPVQSPIMRRVNGKLYFIGGHDSTKGSAGGKYNTCAEYDPVEDQWVLRAPMPTAREDMGSAVIGREIWVFGGLDNRGHYITSDVEVYDTATDTWATRAQWPNPRALGDFACTDGSAIYLISGTTTMDGYPSLSPTLIPQVYENGIFCDLPPMPQGHCYADVELLDGCIYIFGGAVTAVRSYSDRAERFDVRRRTWLDPLEMPYQANSIAATQHRGRLYITGGWYEGQFLSYFFVQDRLESDLLAGAGYGGGSGTGADPYRIWTAEQMNAIGAHPDDWDKHFRLMADLDLSSFDGGEGRPAFRMIAPHTGSAEGEFQGTPFTGVFDGNGHTVSHLTIAGNGYVGVFGLLAPKAQVRDLGVVDINVAGFGDHIGGLAGSSEGVIDHCFSSGTVWGSGMYVGGLVGFNAGEVTHAYSTSRVGSTGVCMGGLAGANAGDVTQCHVEGTVRGNWSVGGLIGQNWGRVQFFSSPHWLVRPGAVVDCHSTCAVQGMHLVGGLVGDNSRDGIVVRSYSAGRVGGGELVGGLVGSGGDGVSRSFWDTQASGQPTSAGGAGLTTNEMQNKRTFLDAGWDLAHETENGTEDTWWMRGGRDYPRLVYTASAPQPYDGAMDILDLPALHWAAGQIGQQYDIYFGDDESAVIRATSQDTSVYRGRQPAGATIYDPGTLEQGKTYYWRIDGVNVADVNSPCKGRIWKFSMADFIEVAVVDDFESYADNIDTGTAIFEAWIDGIGLEPNIPGNGTGSLVGNVAAPFAERIIVHGGRQSMPIGYDNVKPPWYSQVARAWEPSRDWTIDGQDTVTLYFRGEADNQQDDLYVAFEDTAGRTALIAHRDPNAVLTTEWKKWHIPLSEIKTAGADPAAVTRLTVGVGDPGHPRPGGRGRIYIDDIRLTRRMR